MQGASHGYGAVRGREGDAREPGRVRRWLAVTQAGAVLAAALASACCVGPLILALLGLGGAGLLVKFEPWRPWLMALTVVLLAAAFRLAYARPGGGPQADGCACPVPGAQRSTRAMLWVVTILVAALLAFPWVAPVIWG